MLHLKPLAHIMTQIYKLDEVSLFVIDDSGGSSVFSHRGFQHLNNLLSYMVVPAPMECLCQIERSLASLQPQQASTLT